MNKTRFCLFAILTIVCSFLLAADGTSPPAKTDSPQPAQATTPPAATPDEPAKPVLKITPGKVIVPTDAAMRRPWGELVYLSLADRKGKFRKDGTDEIIEFTVLPYAELLHHAAFGDLDDFRPHERVIFRLHPNEKGEWVWLSYIQDEMNMMLNHKEYFYVDSIDADKKTLKCNQANFDRSFIRATDILLETEEGTNYWKDGKEAKFSDIKVGDKLRTKTHGTGRGSSRVCWEVFLDDDSLLKFQAEQKAAHTKRLILNGAPGYVDEVTDSSLDLTIFQEGGEVVRALKAGQKVRVAPAGVDRRPCGRLLDATVTTAKMAGNLGKVTVRLDEPPKDFKVSEVALLWPPK